MAGNDLTSSVEPVLTTPPEPSAAPMELSPTIPPLSTLNSQPQDVPPAPVIAQPQITPSPVVNTPPPGGGATPPPKSGSKLKFVLVLFLLFILGIAGAVAVTTLLPRLRGNIGGEVTLTWWGLWEDEKIVKPLIDEYTSQNPNVKINYVMQSRDDYRERLTNTLAKGEGPDIFRFHNTWTPMFRNSLDSMPSSIMTTSDYSKTFFPVSSADLSVGGDIVGIPLGFDTIGLYINEEIFQTYLKEPPTTWDEFRSLARELTIKSEDGEIRQSGAAMGITQNVDHWPEILSLLMIQNKVKMSNPQGELAETALDFYTRFSIVDKVWDSTLPNSTIAFAGGKLAMYMGPSWRAHEIRQQNPNLKFRVVPVPQIPKEAETDPSISYASYWAEGVWKESKNREAAWKFLQFVSSRESLQKFYQNASNVAPHRQFGEPYSRVDMLDLLTGDPIVGAFVKQGKEAKSWYLASRTFDGPTGINTQLEKYFGDAVNRVNQGERPADVMPTVATGVVQVLSQYGLAKAPATPEP